MSSSTCYVCRHVKLLPLKLALACLSPALQLQRYCWLNIAPLHSVSDHTSAAVIPRVEVLTSYRLTVSARQRVVCSGWDAGVVSTGATSIDKSVRVTKAGPITGWSIVYAASTPQARCPVH